jgi:hypothetical protein
MKCSFFFFFSILTPLFLVDAAKPKLCINCKHCIPSHTNLEYSKCALFPSKMAKINFLVNGIYENDYYYCSTARESNNMCGEEGKMYKKKMIRNKKDDLE